MSALVVPTHDDVVAVMDEVWSTYLGESLLPGVPGAPVLDPWSSSITLRGAWNGLVNLSLSDAAAHDATRRMLAMDDVSAEDVADAVGELVNMVGGNLKSLVTEPAQLSLPVVARGELVLPSDAVTWCAATLAWSVGAVEVTVYEIRGSGGSA